MKKQLAVLVVGLVTFFGTVGVVDATTFDDTLEADTWQSVDGPSGDPATVTDRCLRLFPKVQEDEGDFNWLAMCYPRGRFVDEGDTDQVTFLLRDKSRTTSRIFRIWQANEGRPRPKLDLLTGRLVMGEGGTILAPSMTGRKPHFRVRRSPQLFSGTHLFLDMPTPENPDFRFFVAGDTHLENSKHIEITDGNLIHRAEDFSVLANTSDSPLKAVDARGQYQRFLWEDGQFTPFIRVENDLFGSEQDFVSIGYGQTQLPVQLRGNVANDTVELTYRHNLGSSGLDAHQADAHRARPSNLVDDFPRLSPDDTGVEVVHDGSKKFPPGRYEYLPSCTASYFTDGPCAVHLRSGAVITPESEGRDRRKHLLFKYRRLREKLHHFKERLHH